MRNKIRIRIKDLESIVASTRRSINEAKVEKKEFDINGEDRLGEPAKQQNVPELSDQWYETKALKFVQDYGTNIEDGWEEILAHRYCSSLKASWGVEIDEKKLLDTIKKKLIDRQDMFLNILDVSLKQSLREIAQRLRIEAVNEEHVKVGLKPHWTEGRVKKGSGIAKPRMSGHSGSDDLLNFHEFKETFFSSGKQSHDDDLTVEYMGNNFYGAHHTFDKWMELFQECEMEMNFQ